MSKVTKETWTRVVFDNIDLKSLDEVVVGIQDVEKDSKLGNAFRKSLKVAFGVGLDLIAANKALTIGNAIVALKTKDPEAKRGLVETEFDKVIDASKNENKTRDLLEKIVELNGVSSGATIVVSGDGQDYLVKNQSTDLNFSVKFKMEIE